MFSINNGHGNQASRERGAPWNLNRLYSKYGLLITQGGLLPTFLCYAYVNIWGLRLKKKNIQFGVCKLQVKKKLILGHIRNIRNKAGKFNKTEEIRYQGKLKNKRTATEHEKVISKIALKLQ